MKAINVIFMCLTVATALLSSCGDGESDEMIEKALKRQFQTYPQSTLQDVYKSFFQNRFGPGHIVADVSAAERYLQSELSLSDEFSGEYYEPTGADSCFYRVNLSVVRDSVIPYDVFFDAFIRSTKNVCFPTIEEWRKEWKQVERIVAKSEFRPDGFSADSAAIAQLLDSGEYVMHHSRRYSEAYHPHYRVFERRIFETELLPLIEKALTGD